MGEPLDLVQKHPPGLIIRQMENVNGVKTRSQSHIRIYGVPPDFIRKSDFPYYYIGHAYFRSSQLEVFIEEGSDTIEQMIDDTIEQMIDDTIEQIVEIAPIVFLYKK